MRSTPDPLLTPMQLGAILQATRKTLGMTQSALASRLGLSQSRVSYLELHAHELSVEQLLAWSAVLNLELTIGARSGDHTSSRIHTDW
nr:helix-turn-helix transcriptional regulator [Advenella kashmirensis]